MTDLELRMEFHKFMETHAPKHFEKISKYLDELLENNQYENIFIVSHFGTIQSIICYLMKTPIEDRMIYNIGNTSIYTFEKNSSGNFSMTLENDMKHLYN